MNIEWSRLRTWNGSQNSAFEELCCQLAHSENVPQGSLFIRKGAPDAGIECYWKLPSDEELGWQAKFFTSVPTNQQWQQLDESVQTALAKHPSLIQYTVCLPLDRQDPRKSGEQWFQDRWDERVKKWKQWASEKRMSVDFQYWGEHEIFQRLALDQHSGRQYYWFNEEHLSRTWFDGQLDKAIANAGPRYSPEFNVQLGISRIFDGLGRTPEFYSRLKGFQFDVQKKWKSTWRSAPTDALATYSTLKLSMGEALKVFLDIPDIGIAPINYKAIRDSCLKAAQDAWRCVEELRKLVKSEKTKEAEKKDREELGSGFPQSEQYNHDIHFLVKLSQSINELADFVNTSEAALANTPALLLCGDAGTGKTHLFCDVATLRIKNNLPTIVLLGEQFSDGDPWAEIIQLLGLSCRNEDELLRTLEAAAEPHGGRALILIDALNEGEGKKLWYKHIGGMLATLSRYPYVGLAISVRTSYQHIIVPEHLLPIKLIPEIHRGFSDHEYDASGVFFDFFKIQRPAVPLLVPEFGNPLFLKIFCTGLSNHGMTTIPAGLEGVSAVFEYFIDSINEKLSTPERLDFDLRGRFVQKAVAQLAEAMAESRVNWLKRDDARAIVESVLHSQEYTKSLFAGLISEGLLTEDIVYLNRGVEEEVVRFTYERFGDHLIAKFLLDKHLDTTDPQSSFNFGKPLGELLTNERTIWIARGIVDAFSVQIPEKINKELVEVVPAIKDIESVQESFLESLLWRKPQSIGAATLNYINSIIGSNQYIHDRFTDTLLMLAPKPEHPYNAKFLYKNLKVMSLADRDHRWSIYLHRNYKTKGAVDRMLDWAWSEKNRDYVGDPSLELIGNTLCWFLASSNRFLRDRATKALVTLMENRLGVLHAILFEFLDVNDPYILERLLAVVYGCALRSQDNERIALLAKTIYEHLFLSGSPPPHLLLRDYARGVIEVALHKGLCPDIDVERIRPPYKSAWIPPSSSTDELREKYYPKDWKNNPDYGDIWSSVMGGGDFERYIIGTNSHHFNWANRKLGERKKPSRKALYEKYEKSLVGEKAKALARYVGARNVRDICKRMGKDKPIELSRYSEQDVETLATSAEQYLRSILSESELKLFDEIALPHLMNPYVDEFAFDLSVAQSWIFERIIELGWRPELFAEFDGSIREGMRNSDKPERIGKKYQWLAYYEFIARVADNFEYRVDSWTKETQRYEGPWQDSWRDIDPSFLLSQTRNDSWDSKSCWWFPISYNWQQDIDDVTWLKGSDDLPAVETLIKIENPKDQTKWLVLDGFFRKEQSAPPDEDKHQIALRNWWFMIKSYLVKKQDFETVFRWAKKQNFYGRWMPEAADMTKVFIGEYPWAPAFQYQNTPYFSHYGWTRNGRSTKIPKPVLVTNDQYLWERGYDCSISEAILSNLPAKMIVDEMNLRWSGTLGTYFDATGKVSFFDPSIVEHGPGALLAREDSFLSFLNERGYDILWVILGEKNMIGGRMSHEDWKGSLEVSGAYRLISSTLMGNLSTNFRSRETQ